MSFLDTTGLRTANPADEPKEVATALQSLLVKQLITSSGLFKSQGTALGGAGSKVSAELFAETLAEAVTQSGQVNLSSAVEAQLAQAVPHAAQQLIAPTVQAPAQNVAPSPSSGLSFGLPLAAASSHISSAFGTRVDPIDGALRKHSGVDIAAATGSPILATQDGVVVSAGERGGYGQAVEIQHSGGVSTLYAHASELLVKPGEHVLKGQEIGKVGQTGRATGPHLHYEVRQGGHPLNPTRALSAYSRRADTFGKTRGKP